MTIHEHITAEEASERVIEQLGITRAEFDRRFSLFQLPDCEKLYQHLEHCDGWGYQSDVKALADDETTVDVSTLTAEGLVRAIAASRVPIDYDADDPYCLACPPVPEFSWRPQATSDPATHPNACTWRQCVELAAKWASEATAD